MREEEIRKRGKKVRGEKEARERENRKMEGEHRWKRSMRDKENREWKCMRENWGKKN